MEAGLRDGWRADDGQQGSSPSGGDSISGPMAGDWEGQSDPDVEGAPVLGQQEEGAVIRQGRQWRLQVQICTDGGRRSRQVSASAREVRRVRTVQGGTAGGREGLRIECHLADEHELAGMSGKRMATSAGQGRATGQVWQEGGPHDDDREGRGAKRRASGAEHCYSSRRTLAVAACAGGGTGSAGAHSGAWS